MGVQGTIQTSGTLTLAGGDVDSPSFAWPFTNGVIGSWSGVLQNGDNTIPIPTGATMVRVLMNPGNSQACTYRTLVGDTGSKIHPALPFIMTLPTASPPTNVYLNSAATQTGLTTYVWFT